MTEENTIDTTTPEAEEVRNPAAVLAKNKELLARNAELSAKLEDAATRIAELEAAQAERAAIDLANSMRAAALEAGALPDALDDVMARASKRCAWKCSKNGTLTTADGETFNKDGTGLLTFGEWLADTRDAAPHLWPKAQGTGAPGSSNNNVYGTSRPAPVLTSAPETPKPPAPTLGLR